MVRPRGYSEDLAQNGSGEHTVWVSGSRPDCTLVMCCEPLPFQISYSLASAGGSHERYFFSFLR